MRSPERSLAMFLGRLLVLLCFVMTCGACAIRMNDFFPFNRAELITAEPEIFQLLQSIWGPVQP